MILAFTTLLLIGCAKSGSQSLIPSQTTQTSTLALGSDLANSCPTSPSDSIHEYDQTYNTKSVDLRQKSPDNWEFIDGGASGTLTYNVVGPRFVYEFHGTLLEANTLYSLIYYAESEVGSLNLPSEIPGALIADGTSDSTGNIYLQGSNNLSMDLPTQEDANYEWLPCALEYGPNHGAKIWLVPSDCYDPNNKVVRQDKWQPDRFLFETLLIAYFDSNGPYE